MIQIENINFEKMNGIVPSIIVDRFTNQVLMLGFMNRESLSKTLETKLVCFYSRTKNNLWTKGETSGNFLKLVDIITDCDNDSLLVYVIPHGNTCHMGNYSCFGLERKSLGFLDPLQSLIKSRKENLPENSYTASLFLSGSDRIIQKFGEESVETLIAAKNRKRDEVINEASDLIYHLLVMLEEQNININEITDKLMSRHNIQV